MGGLMLSPAEEPTTNTIDAWLAEHGPDFARRVRVMFGDSPDDCLAMLVPGC